MKRLKRAPLMIGASVILPVVIFLGLQLAFSAQDERIAAETQVRARTERVIIETDGALQRTLAALDVLATAPMTRDGDWRALHGRLRQLQDIESEWITVLLLDIRAGRAVFDIRRPYGAPVQGISLPLPATRSSKAFAGGVGGRGEGCPCALVYRFIPGEGDAHHLLVAAIDTRPLLEILAREVEPGRVGALVDRDGRFLARTIDHRRRVGTHATPYVRRAIRTGRAGIYPGRTWEGFESYTAFSTSDLTGWSAHIAFSPSLIDSPRWRSLGAAGGSALAALLLSLALVWFTLRQIAEGRRVQERLLEAQKMEALGQITGGIAHDFNNLMTPIVGGLDLVARDSKLSPRSRRVIEGALASSRKAAKLTAQLLAFSRRQRLEIAPVPLATLFAGLKPLLAQSVGSGIAVEMSLADDTLCVQSDANQLELALLNLALNARDAIEGHGTIRIAARPAAARKGQPPTVLITVEDDGAGMAPDVLSRATEPFYTTKPPGQGTGLGLAQVYGTIRQSEGTMTVESVPGSGTTISLTLPACRQAPEPAPAAETAHGRSAGAGKRIILCDDDDAVRTFVSRVLDEAGYVVESVSDGRSAVEVARNSPADLLVLDFAMQAMDGAEVVRAVRKRDPDLPVLLITGYADSEVLNAAAADIPVLRKPFDAEALLAAVERALAPISP